MYKEDKDQINEFYRRYVQLKQISISEYMTDKQYKYYKKLRDELEDDISYYINSLFNNTDRLARENTISNLKKELKDEIRLFGFKSRDDFKKFLDHLPSPDGPGDYAGQAHSWRLYSFWEKFPDILKSKNDRSKQQNTK